MFYTALILVLFIATPRNKLPSSPSKAAAEEASAQMSITSVEIPNNNEAINSSHESQSSLSLEKINRNAKDESLTKLQRAQFIGRMEGKPVTVEGIVLEVERSGFGSGEDILVTFSSGDDKRPLPEIFIAQFSHSLEADLAPLRRGYHITISGDLHFVSTAGDPLITFENCELLAFEKPDG